MAILRRREQVLVRQIHPGIFHVLLWTVGSSTGFLRRNKGTENICGMWGKTLLEQAWALLVVMKGNGQGFLWWFCSLKTKLKFSKWPRKACNKDIKKITKSFADDLSNKTWLNEKTWNYNYRDYSWRHDMEGCLPQGGHSLLWHNKKLHRNNENYKSGLS